MRGLAVSAPSLIEIPFVAVAKGEVVVAVVQRDSEVGAKPRALGAGEQRSRWSFVARGVTGRAPGGSAGPKEGAGGFLGGAGGVE
jgi:hypothetical protein